jgi:uncharacterized membrane protein YkvI
MLQSVIIAGGYGTGREVLQYFTSTGLYVGILGIFVATVSMAVVFVLSLEIARVFKVYDYRNFFKVLLGRVWFVYEILGVMLFMLVFAVIGAAAGEVLQREFGLHPMAGVAVMLLTVTLLVFYGRELITRMLTYWSLFLYLVFGVYVIAVFMLLGDDVSRGFAARDDSGEWLLRGGQYTFYNMTAIPIILYGAMAIKTRHQAVIAGVVGALIALVPGLILHVSFAAQYPAILEAPLPIYAIFTALDIGILKFAYLLMLLGTFVETGAGNLQGFVERLDGWWKETRGRPMSRSAHATIALVAMTLAGGLSHFGIVALIEDGYGTLAWGFMVVYAVPLLTIGVYRLSKRSRELVSS